MDKDVSHPDVRTVPKDISEKVLVRQSAKLGSRSGAFDIHVAA